MLNPKIKPTKSNIEGTGLIAQEFISKGTVVWQLDPTEKQLTLDELNKLPKERKKLAYQYKDKFIIVSDGSEYMNHSCDPNTGWLNDKTLVATKDIKPGEEVTYDYATAEINPDFREEWECRCNSANCRKIIRGSDCLNPKFIEKYKGMLPSWTQKFIQTQNSPASHRRNS